MKRALLLSAMLAFTAPAAFAAEPNVAMQSYLNDVVMPWSHEGVLVDAVKAQNAKTSGYDAAQIEALDQTWRAEVGAAATPTIDPVLHNAAADFLRNQVEASGGVITEVFIMDAKGLNVAASGVTSDYWQGDEEKHQMTYSKGPDAVHFSEIEFDESSQTYQAQISISLTDPANGEVIGAMTVGIVADALM
ncbi:hypothetical protein [Primorskyibacter sp. 2E233]|uniref:hypothetical protein n=1 Tax=Primorskyibacter sp. 2E233 TaxID=3413431 RepID=UPI003BF241B9